MKPWLKVSTPQGESGRIVSVNDDYLFRYGDEAAANAAVSLLMPLRTEDYRSRDLHPIFQMNLPEGYVLEQLRNRLRIPRHPATQSALIWPGIPRPSGHLFHGHPAGQSERSDAGGALLV